MQGFNVAITRKHPENIDGYIDQFPTEMQKRLRAMRETIRKSAPKAEETISYGMPAFKLSRILVWFAGFKHHIGFYPGASGIAAFKKELSPYKGAKGSVQFPLDKPLPLTLVGRIVKFRVQETLESRPRK